MMQRKHDDSAANYAAYIYLIQTVLEVQQKMILPKIWQTLELKVSIC